VKGEELGVRGEGLRGTQETHHAEREERSARYWITYNGEIYNYRQLRDELTKDDSRDAINSKNTINAKNAPPPWRSNTDTEVILRAYARWGRDCLTRLRGMFAFAIWDEQKKELFLARDPFGIKPLYYYQTDGLFLFASEVRALLASGLVPRKLSLDGLASYLQFGSVQDPLTIIDGVRSLLPGQCLVVKNSASHLQTKQLPFNQIANIQHPRPNSTPKSRAEAVKLLRGILEDSVRHHLVSDVPVGAFLSGGIDSSTVVALMAKVAEQRPKTFSVVFSESEYSEAQHARLVAKTFGTEHREILLSEDRLLGLLPSALEAMDQPTMDGVNTYVVSTAVRDAGIKVALSGLGGDELFAGYPSFRRAQQLRNMAMLPQPVRNAVGVVGRAFLNGSTRHRKFWDLVESDCSPHAAYSISRQLFSAEEIAALTGRGRRSEVRDRSEAQNPTPNSPHPDGDVINAVSRYEVQGYMSNTLLRDTDQMSMAHALEVRVPFVDQKVAEFVLSLPGEWKLNGVCPKPLLVDALSDLLPEVIWRRPKMGFTLPFDRWMHSALKAGIDAVLSDQERLGQAGISGFAKNVWATFLNNPQKERWSRPWALFILKRWCEINDVAL
jgi:asparagine synthase (glutamine-hydrolysing)